ncbi:MAG: DUF1003 domain-containing protein [Frankia sp.]|nr:DUF1003 domain-containing protein [Frankia sp.]
MSITTTASRHSADRLDVPAAGRTILLPRSVNREAFSRSAERIARFLGTGRYLAIQTVVVIVWIGLNIALPFLRWDPYPFILLNLAFSTQAAYAAPLILLAQNRQDDRDRATLAEDRATASRIREDTEFLAREVAALRLAHSESATRQYVRGELTHQLESLRADLRELVLEAVRTATADASANGRPRGEAVPVGAAAGSAGGAGDDGAGRRSGRAGARSTRGSSGASSRAGHRPGDRRRAAVLPPPTAQLGLGDPGGTPARPLSRSCQHDADPPGRHDPAD